MGKGWTDTGYFTIVSNYVLEDVELSAKARFVYTLLIRYGRWKKVGNEKYLVAWVGRAKLAELTGESDWSVSKRIRELVDRGLIERSRRPGGSSITYICDPRPIYTEPPDIPDMPPPESPDDGESLEILDGEAQEASLAGSHVIVGSSTRRDEAEPMTVVAQNGPQEPQTSSVAPTAEPEKDVASQDIAILSDNSRDKRGSDGPERKSDDTGNDGATCTDSRSRRSRAVGLLARRAENQLTSKSKSKIEVPDDAMAVDEGGAQTARDLWNEFQRVMTETHSGYSLPDSPTMRELGNCKKMLKEYDLDDILGMFDMVATRWAVILEKWPRLAKTQLPTFYAAFTLRRELIPLVQSGKGLTSRTHRYDPGAEKPPAIGWGDE